MTENDPLFKHKPFFEEWIDQLLGRNETPQQQASAYAQTQKQINAPKSTALRLPTPQPITIKPEYSPRQRTIGIDTFMRKHV